MNAKLEVFSDLSEELNYNLPEFPLYVRKGLLNQFDKYAAACHWHPDLKNIETKNGIHDKKKQLYFYKIKTTGEEQPVVLMIVLIRKTYVLEPRIERTK